jgi:hypothetical protein
MRLFRLGLVAIAGYAAAPAAAQNDPVSLRQAVLACYQQKASQFDDGISDARTIGAVVSLECYDVELREIQVRMRTATDLEAVKLHGNSRETLVTRASGAVLARRIKLKSEKS